MTRRSSLPAIPLIAGSFGVEAVDVNVAISAYLVTVAVLIPATGWMADRFGVRRVFIAAIAVFTIASIGCAARCRCRCWSACVCCKASAAR